MKKVENKNNILIILYFKGVIMDVQIFIEQIRVLNQRFVHI